MALKAFLFDKDGTLVDAFGGWVALVGQLVQELAGHYGPVDPFEVDRALGISGAQVVPGGVVASGTEEDLFRELHRLLGPAAPAWERFFPQVRTLTQRFFDEVPPAVHPIGRVGPALADLAHRGYRLGVATSDTYANAYRDLADHGATLIEYWATADRVDRPKPHPESVLRFAAAVGVDPSEVAFVGDSPVDLEAARAAGVGLFIAVRSLSCPPQVLAAADLVVDSIDQLPGAVSGS